MSDVEIAIDPDIRVAKTLPARVYSDPGAFRAQREMVFARTWHYAGHDDLVRVPGQVHPFTLLPGALDEPLVLTRDGDDRLHCLSNVCTHRGTLVVDGPRHAQVLRCRYHGRRFALDGRFQSMPEFEGAVGFPSAADDLPRDYPVTQAESSTDYDMVKLRGLDVEFLLPIRSEFIIGDRRERGFSRNLIHFKFYRKFETDVKIVDDPTPIKK